MRYSMAFSEPYNISRMRNESAPYNPQHLLWNSEKRSCIQQVRRPYICRHRRRWTQALGHTLWRIETFRKNGRLTFTGKIRYYEGSSDRLTYHIRRGAPEFDNWWFNDNGFTEVKSVTLPSCFTAQKTIFRHCRIAAQRYIKCRDRKKQMQSRPVPRPKMIYRQRKRSSYGELPTFDRKW